MAIRVKSNWHSSQRNRPAVKTLEDNARALAFIAWRLALETAKNLYQERFEYRSDKQRIGVICEALAFQLQSADRLAHSRLDDADREVFINELAQRLADHMQDNMADLAGPGAYRAPFIDLLNRRGADYAQLSFEDNQPGYDFLRYFGCCVLEVMGGDQTNKWVIDQAIEIESPELTARFGKGIKQLFGW